MWEEGARIYGTPGVYNNFPDLWLENIHTKKKKKKSFETTQWNKSFGLSAYSKFPNLTPEKAP